MMMMKMVDMIAFLDLLLRQRPPGLARDRSFLTIHTDDEDFAFGPDKRREISIQNLAK